eukprot:Seg2325.1 transcript_id=Seg2325.1/GoldUCD/mRNA.D3Y31 product="Solute carrier family 22 member 1" protein_id=Seg2325.1/GoldUCD/D3Y31
MITSERSRTSLQRKLSRRSSVSVRQKTNNLDEVLEAIGGCSHFQMRRHVLFFLLTIPFACQNLLMVFAGQNPGICVPHGHGFTQCRPIEGSVNGKYCPVNSRYRFVKDDVFSILTEFHLLCEKGYLEQVANSAYFVGAFIGTILIGWIAERFGRKSVMFCCMTVVMLIAGMTALAKTLWFFIMARFLTGFFLSGFAVTIYVIASEIISLSYRSISSVFLWNYFSAGLMILGLKAYMLQNWRNLQLATTLPYLIVFVLYRYIPESLRWLWNNGEYTRANKTILKIADENKTSEKLSLFPEVLSIETDDSQNTNCCLIFMHKSMLHYTFIMAYTSLVVGILYFGFFLISDVLSGNVYVDFVLMALMEIPANFLSIFCAGRFGRKKTFIISMLMTSIATASLYPIITRQITAWRSTSLCVGLFGKLFLMTSMVSFTIWSPEIYTNIIRTKGIGFISALRLLGGAVAPWLTSYLLKQNTGLPFAIMSGLAGFAALISMLLPETREVVNSKSYEDLQSDFTDMNTIINGTMNNRTISLTMNNTTMNSVSDKTIDSNNTNAKNNNETKDETLDEENFEYAGLLTLDRETNL